MNHSSLLAFAIERNRKRHAAKLEKEAKEIATGEALMVIAKEEGRYCGEVKLPTSKQKRWPGR